MTHQPKEATLRERERVWRALGSKWRTAIEIAQDIGMDRVKVRHHLNALEQERRACIVVMSCPNRWRAL